MEAAQQPNPIKLQKRLNDLHTQRKHIVNNIKTTIKRKRLISQTLKEHQQQPKLVKLQDSIIKSQDSIGEHHKHLNTQEEEIKKVVEAQNKMKERNRRMLGGLNGYLKKAESRLKQEVSKAKQKMEIEEKNIQREKEQMAQLHNQKLRELENQLTELNGKKDQNSAQMLQLQNALLKHKFVTYVSDLSHYLFTTTQPALPWKPSSTSPALAALAEQQLTKRKEEEQRVVESIDNYQKKFDYRKYVLQNQRQYYNHILDGYLKTRSNFIVTKTLPSIQWLPAPAGLKKCSDLLHQSQEMLLKEGNSVKQQNEQHYIKAKSPSHEYVVEEQDSYSAN